MGIINSGAAFHAVSEWRLTMNLADIKAVEALLKKNGFSFKKTLGQNFLINPEVCPAMASAACNGKTGVLEIGPGIGVLTAELAKKAKRVVAIELDERLKTILPETLKDFSNIEIIYGDVMKLDLHALIKNKFSDCERVTVCANLPYYITSPVIMLLLESRLPVESITVMVQKEAAERLCAEVGSRAAGAVTVAVKYYASTEILFEVDRSSFIPSPNVDSAVIRLVVRDAPPIAVKDEAKFFRLVKACFAQRRKTLCNTVSNTLSLPKEKIRAALNSLSLPETVRGEELTIDQLAELCELLFE